MDQAFDQSFVRSFSQAARRAAPQRGLGAPPSPSARQTRPARPATGVGQASTTPAPAVTTTTTTTATSPGPTPWDTTQRGPIPPGLVGYDPPPGGPTWQNYAWIYMSTGGFPTPSAPPPGVTGATGGVIGTWVETDTNRWVWFAPDNALTQINGVWVMDNSNAAATPSPWTAFPAPTLSPDGTQGTWSEPHKGYWIWVSGASTAAAASATTSTGTIVLLTILGLGAIGGIGYLLLD